MLFNKKRLKNHAHHRTFWHHVDVRKVLSHLQSSELGLSQAISEERLEKHGLNVIIFRERDTIWNILWRQLKNPLVYVLLSTTILAFSFGDIANGLVVLSVVVFNTVIGFYQEYRAHKTIEVLQSMMPDKVVVLRNGNKQEIAVEKIVPGDVLALQAGDRVAADMRLISSAGLKCDESMLTGESVSVEKQTNALPESTSLADRTNMLFKGTHITSGSGMAIVVATGMESELGKISGMMEKVLPLETPLAKSLRKVANLITLCILFVSIALLIAGWLRGAGLYDAALSAITLAVAAIPEGLPAIVTISAAIGVRRMAKRKAIIRQLPAVEVLGSTTVICTDKTGTLTQNEMTVQKIWTYSGFSYVSGLGYELHGNVSCGEGVKEKEVWELLQAGVLCNDASIKQHQHKTTTVGDPTEIALLVAAKKSGIDEALLKKKWHKIDEVPFTSEHKIMITLCESSHGNAAFLKGSPEEVLNHCSLSAKEKKELLEIVASLAKEGLRVLGLAEKKTQKCSAKLLTKNGYSLLGFVGMIDPPRKEVFKALESCRSAGVTVKMITGDHPLTAATIGKSLNICSDEKVITGNELEGLSPYEWKSVASDYNVFARANPEHKLKLVEALQKKGHVVAMTGDGVNDAPALKKADIGVAMGIKGTAVAKEASDMILTNDNFANIEAAVEEGRRVYDNLMKSILFVLTTSLGQSLIIFIAVLFFPILNGRLMHPILPVQILWINLIVAAGLAIPLAFEPMEKDIMKRPPRPKNAPLIHGRMLIKICFVSLCMAMGTIALYFWKRNSSMTEDLSLSTMEAKSQTVAILALVLFQIFYLLDCRSFSSFWRNFSLKSNPFIVLGVIAVLLSQCAFIYIPFMNKLFHSSPIGWLDWGVSLGLAFILFVLASIDKFIYYLLKKK